jgi:hypothetical protein
MMILVARMMTTAMSTRLDANAKFAIRMTKNSACLENSSSRDQVSSIS